jgi:hypothetical protein
VAHGMLTIGFMIVSKFSGQKFVEGWGHGESAVGFCWERLFLLIAKEGGDAFWRVRRVMLRACLGSDIEWVGAFWRVRLGLALNASGSWKLRWSSLVSICLFLSQ